MAEYSRVFWTLVDASGRYSLGGSLGRVHLFFPGGQVIT